MICVYFEKGLSIVLQGELNLICLDYSSFFVVLSVAVRFMLLPILLYTAHYISSGTLI